MSSCCQCFGDWCSKQTWYFIFRWFRKTLFNAKWQLLVVQLSFFYEQLLELTHCFVFFFWPFLSYWHNLFCENMPPSHYDCTWHRSSSSTIDHELNRSKINDSMITVAFFVSPPHPLSQYIMENMRYYSMWSIVVIVILVHKWNFYVLTWLCNYYILSRLYYNMGIRRYFAITEKKEVYIMVNSTAIDYA